MSGTRSRGGIDAALLLHYLSFLSLSKPAPFLLFKGSSFLTLGLLGQGFQLREKLYRHDLASGSNAYYYYLGALLL